MAFYRNIHCNTCIYWPLWIWRKTWNVTLFAVVGVDRKFNSLPILFIEW